MAYVVYGDQFVDVLTLGESFDASKCEALRDDGSHLYTGETFVDNNGILCQLKEAANPAAYSNNRWLRVVAI